MTASVRRTSPVPAVTFSALGLRPGRSGPTRCALSRSPLLAFGRAARAPLAALAHVLRSRPSAGPLGPRCARSSHPPVDLLLVVELLVGVGVRRELDRLLVAECQHPEA